MLNNLAIDFYDEEEIQEQENEGFKVTDEGSAAWTLRLIEKLNRKIQFVENGYGKRIEQLEHEIKKAQTEKNKVVERAGGQIEYFKGLLKEYVDTLDADLFDEKKTQRNIIVAGHKLSIKKPTQKMVKADEDKLLAYLKDYDNDFIKTKESVDWAGFKKRLVVEEGNVIDPDTGSVVDGVSVVDTPEELIIKE